MGARKRPYKIRVRRHPTSDDPILDLHVSELPGIKSRTASMLEENGVIYLHQLLGKSQSDLLGLRNFGRKTINDIYESLELLELLEIIEPKRSDA